ncbi:MAG TPA: NADH-quinone oxidoreductase subunit L [Candidatus Limnocylindrales bacterium]|nr:NADH-quinone oxidoreductase subunit L [Candidatus Limnocylindrales bacterium]
MFILDHLWIILALPLAGSMLTLLAGRHWPKKYVNFSSVGFVVLAFLSYCELAREFFTLSPSQIPWLGNYFTWMVAGNFHVNFALQVDQLTIVMLGVVTLVGMLIHIYSVGYMAHEEGYYRFFAEMNLFMFFMLTLVMASNLVLLFVGWEGVGLCSYLLISFFFQKKSAADAGKKAFITTRIGDFGFTLGILMAFWTFGSVNYKTMFAAAANMPVEGMHHWGVLTAICLLLLAGAVGKSAQLPLYVWLPDAMEGPTPVSALIHAATMVTAGVYMVARMNVLFSHAPAASFAVAIIGAVTALYAASIALVQNDIKKVLAYSTISQLGYMFLACGVGAYAAGIFHLMTHAFFKALLFLAAGSVIHAMGGEQDMRGMGGLRKKIPWTYGTMLVATLAISGAPLFAGFFSKDEILFDAYAGPNANIFLYGLGIFAALLTAFYMFRLIFMTFYGPPRYDEHHVHVHESPKVMLAPLAILAVLSVIGGWFALPPYWGGKDYFQGFLDPVFASSTALAARMHPAWSEPPHSLELTMTAIAVLIAFIGFLTAWYFYIHKPALPKKVAGAFGPIYRLLLGKYFVDELYGAVIIGPIVWLSRNILWKVIDVGLIDGTVNGLAFLSRETGSGLRHMQGGNTRSYAAWVVVGAVAVTLFFVWMVR